MTCVFVPQIPIYGVEETPIYGNDESAIFGDLPPCTLTLRDQFAMSALVDLGANQTYNFSIDTTPEHFKDGFRYYNSYTQSQTKRY